MPAPTPAPTPEPARPVGAEGEPFLGEWHGVSMETEGMVLSFTDFGMVMVLTLNEDGTASVFDGEELDATVWKVEDGMAVVQSARGSIQADGMLCLEDEGSKLYFTRDAADGPAVSATEAPPAPQPGNAAQERLDRKYVCVSADIDGYAIDASLLGGEYALTFHSDGTADFVMVGTGIPGLRWTPGTVQTDAGEAEAFLVDYYGSSMAAVWTEEGFDMNYFDSMLMHFAPEP